MHLHLENYKSIINNSFEFSKVNILIGENSAGKSSLIKFFILLKQSLIGFKNRSSFNISLKGEFFDFGSFKDIISFNELNNKLVFEFEFKNYHQFYFDFFQENLGTIIENHPQVSEDFLNLTLNNEVKIKFEIDPTIKKHDATVITIYSKYIGEIVLKSYTQENLTFKQDLCNILHSTPNKTIEYSSVEFEREAFFKFVKAESLQESIKLANEFQSEEEVIKEFLPLTYLLIGQNYLENILENIEYINPLHSNPKRYFMLEETGSSTANFDLDYIVNKLNDDEVFTKETRQKLVETLNEAIVFLGIADEIKFELAEKMPVVELKAKIKDFWSNITDVGYGLSLQLPILFRTIIAGLIDENRILLIEQPEVHLHPQLQAKFIETIIKYGGNSIFFIETHSEHIIRKLQSLVKSDQNELAPSDVSIYYFKREKLGSTISEHRIQENGKLTKNFPSGFFDSSYLLAKELL
jgi:predicted ATPase